MKPKEIEAKDILLAESFGFQSKQPSPYLDTNFLYKFPEAQDTKPNAKDLRDAWHRGKLKQA